MMRKLLITILCINLKISSGKPQINSTLATLDNSLDSSITFEDANSLYHLNTIVDNNPTLTIKELLDNSTSIVDVTEEVLSEVTTIEPEEPETVTDVSDEISVEITTVDPEEPEAVIISKQITVEITQALAANEENDFEKDDEETSLNIHMLWIAGSLGFLAFIFILFGLLDIKKKIGFYSLKTTDPLERLKAPSIHFYSYNI